MAFALITAALGVACTQGGQQAETAPPPAADQGAAAPATVPPAAPPGEPARVGSALPPPAASGSRTSAPASGRGSSAPASGAHPAASSAAPPAAAVAAPPPEPPKPLFKEVTVPAGTSLSVTLETSLASDKNKLEDPVRGKLAKAIVIDGVTVVPAGSALSGAVTEAVPSGKVKGVASLAFRFTSLTAHDEKHQITASRISRVAESTKKEDAKKVGIGAGAGALIGAIAGGGKGAAIGTAVGAGAGTGMVMATKGDEVEVASGTTVTSTLQEAIAVLVPNH